MNMIQRINDIIKDQHNGKIASEDIFIIDYKNINGGQVEVVDTKPEFQCVHLINPNNIEVIYVAFLDNALKDTTPAGQLEQCECVLFPSSMEKDDWILFVETKYSADFRAAMDKGYDYPNKMIRQIISTVNYFRHKEILPPNKQVQAIISFPRLIEPFSEAVFTRSHITQTDISLKYKITLKAANKGEIKSQKRIKV